MGTRWLGLQFKCSVCGKVFQVGKGGFKLMKERIMEHAEEELKKRVQFSILPTNPGRAIGMRWLCSYCGHIERLTKSGLDDLEKRVTEHALTHQGADFRIVPIG